MLGGAWLLITILLIIAAAIWRQSMLLVVAAIFFLTSGVARLWSRYALNRIEYKRRLSSEQVFYGESVTLDLSIANLKFLPLPWLRIDEEVPDELTLLTGKTQPSHKPGRAVISKLISLTWYHRLTRRYTLQCSKRGIFQFGPTSINAGDPFGFFRKEINLEAGEQLIVYPRILPLEELGIPSRHPFGDLRVRKHLFEDPILVMTTRDYVAGDPLKRIHWKATARSQVMQSRVFEHTTSVDMALFLDTRTVADTIYWSLISPDFLETAVLAAASISADALENEISVGFYSNEYYWYSERMMKLAPSSHPGQLKKILEALAQVKGLPALTVEKLLHHESRNLPWETTVVMITSVLTAELTAALSHLQKSGRKTALVLVGARSVPPQSRGLLTYCVSEEVYQKKLGAISLKPGSL